MSAFFLSSESEAPAAYLINKLCILVEPELNCLNLNKYGDEINKIFIISVVLKRDTIENGVKERRLFSRKTKEADIRLFIDFDGFVKASPRERYKIYVSHIFECMDVIKLKVSKNYQIDFLVQDMKKILSDPILVEKCSTISRFV